MKLNLRTFLFLSLLLGTVALPLGYKYLGARRLAEIERLNEELTTLLRNEPLSFSNFGSFGRLGLRGESDWVELETPAWREWSEKVNAVRDRLKKLTGTRPERRAVHGES